MQVFGSTGAIMMIPRCCPIELNELHWLLKVRGRSVRPGRSLLSTPFKANPYVVLTPVMNGMIWSYANESASHKLKTLLMFPEDVVSAVGAVVGLVEAGLHEEGEATEEGSDAAADRHAPQVGSVARLQVHHCHY
jgi:hypothetical protein